MADQVNVHEAKTTLSKLLERVEAGEEIVIARNGKPVARLIADPVRREPRKPGAWKGQIKFAPDWDSPEVDEEIARTFHESKIFPDEEP